MNRTRVALALAAVLVAGALVVVVVGRARRGSDAAPSSVPPNPAGTVPPGTPAPVARRAEIRPGVEPTGEVRSGTITTPDGRTRSYRVYLPTSPPPAAGYPVLLGLHGGTGWGAQFERDSGFDRLAESNGVIAVYPDGIGAGPREGEGTDGFAARTWNGGVCCGPAAREQVDDVGFLRTLIDTVVRDHHGDPDRVVVTGHSNGAIMAYRLACEASDRIAAIAVFAGTLGVPSCDAGSPVSLMHLHGTADQNLPVAGGVGRRSLSQVAFPPPLDGVHRVAAADGCTGDGVRSRSTGNPDVETTVWTPCAAGAEVQFVTIDGASHAWPGSEGGPRLDRLGIGQPYERYDASAELLAFLLAHPKAR